MSVYVGHVYLARAAGATLPRGPKAWNEYLDAVLEVLIPKVYPT